MMIGLAGWAYEFSNFGIRQDKNLPVRRLEYWRNWPRRRSRDYSRLSCGVANMQLQQDFDRRSGAELRAG